MGVAGVIVAAVGMAAVGAAAGGVAGMIVPFVAVLFVVLPLVVMPLVVMTFLVVARGVVVVRARPMAMPGMRVGHAPRDRTLASAARRIVGHLRHLSPLPRPGSKTGLRRVNLIEAR
jgi:hypothetical protein